MMTIGGLDLTLTEIRLWGRLKDDGSLRSLYFLKSLINRKNVAWLQYLIATCIKILIFLLLLLLLLLLLHIRLLRQLGDRAIKMLSFF